jgi:hypothetical protein
LSGLFLLVVCLVPFLLVQRWLHREIQSVFLLLTRRPTVSLGLFSLLFFPGVLLHETSHFAMARLLGVRTAGFSLLPQVLPNGQLRLGYVETVQADLVRDAFIGTAPLITGGVLIAVLGTYQLGLIPLADFIKQGNWNVLWQALAALPDQPDFWLWFYLAFAVSSMMMPSASDRRAWLPVLVVIVVLFGLAALAGAGPWLLANLAPLFNQALYAVALVFGVSLLLHTVLVIPIGLFRVLLNRLTGLTVG